MRIIVCVMMLCMFSSCHPNTPSEGKKVGSIVKLAKEGLFYKTWEGELIRGRLNDGSGSFGSIFLFVIEDIKLVEKAMYAMENNKEVIIYYHCETMSSLSRSEHDYPHFVDNIQIIN